MKRKMSVLSSFLVFGYAFLYIPIVTLIIYSFNSSKHVCIWGGVALKWYGALFRNTQLLQAAWISLRIALACATLSDLLGLCGALILTKLKKFFGRGFFQGIVKAPLMMPEVIMGLSLLLLLINMEQLIGWPETGTLTTITIAHTTLAVAYVTSIIYTQLSSFDDSLTEAAMDLGAGPIKSFFLITLPILSPSLVAGWLLAFVLSLDDVVLASFVAGPKSTTLPMMIYSSVRYGLTPQINALATIVIAIVTLCILAAALMHRRSSQRHKSATASRNGGISGF